LKGNLQDGGDLGDLFAIRKLGMDGAINFMAVGQIDRARNFTIGDKHQNSDFVVVSHKEFFDFNVYLECDELILKFFKIN
jgi:hypothetical protein